MQNLQPGQVVYSVAGRDEGRKFIVLSIIDDNYVYISDGDLRKVTKPKKKKVKHLKPTGIVANSIKEKLLSNKRIEDFEIRDYLTLLSKKEQEV
ncbi:KOW domain-containing RNA-binding protein [Lutispora thermophila]|uniref:Ribosomal protein L14E/L6E/L27E n=1 Tax=Lutispora thermophila DSM 19022 TaxID=1122184 RepID=A0A1M6DWZ9_9FIRM|nr:KOW domain-containing RNA-binding protein [Lutispora thermophila]SHI77649.1 Ribosomal protein L14E/L6E/L27E [Lutispora thermophila DSM 19022]